MSVGRHHALARPARSPNDDHLPLRRRLDSMLAAKIAHCDLKPENIMVLHAGSFAGWPRIKVVDFGVARFLDREDDEGQVAGTPMYMAPEQWRGHADERSDVYALGCMLY